MPHEHTAVSIPHHHCHACTQTLPVASISTPLPRSIRIFSHTGGHSREVYTAKRMQRVFAVKFSGDATYVFSGSDDMNVRVWKVRRLALGVSHMHGVHVWMRWTACVSAAFAQTLAYGPCHALCLSSTGLLSSSPVMSSLQSEASEQLGVLLPRERQKHAYKKALVERYKHMPDVKRIIRHRHLPAVRGTGSLAWMR